MSLNGLIQTTLNPIGVPVRFMVYEGTATTYVTYMQYNEFGTLFGEDEELRTQHSVQISIFSKGDNTATVAAVKDRMKAAGFRRNNEFDLYEGDTKTYHKVLRYFYTK